MGEYSYKDVMSQIENASNKLCIYVYYYEFPSEKNELGSETNIFLNKNQSPENILKDFISLL